MLKNKSAERFLEGLFWVSLSFPPLSQYTTLSVNVPVCLGAEASDIHHQGEFGDCQGEFKI